MSASCLVLRSHNPTNYADCGITGLMKCFCHLSTLLHLVRVLNLN
jgi:hypothetical protein